MPSRFATRSQRPGRDLARLRRERPAVRRRADGVDTGRWAGRRCSMAGRYRPRRSPVTRRRAASSISGRCRAASPSRRRSAPASASPTTKARESCTSTPAIPRVILPPAGRPAFCPPPPTAGLEPARSPFAFAARTLASWLAPQPAYAARAMMPAIRRWRRRSGVGPERDRPGGVHRLPRVPGHVPNAARSDTAKSLDGDPLTSQFSPIIRVRAVSAAGQNPLAGVTITFSRWSATRAASWRNNVTAVTDANGYASVPELLHRQGRRIRDHGLGAGVRDAGAARSNQFNISGQ